MPLGTSLEPSKSRKNLATSAMAKKHANKTNGVPAKTTTRTVRPALVMTIASDDEVEPESESDNELSSPLPQQPSRGAVGGGKKRKRQVQSGDGGGGLSVDPSFSFDADSARLGIAERQAVRGWDFKSECLRMCCSMVVMLCCVYVELAVFCNSWLCRGVCGKLKQSCGCILCRRRNMLC